MTAAHRAMTQLESWPNLVSGSPRCAVGRSFGTAGCDIVHFHANDAADLYLTRTAVERLLPQLRDSTAIRVRPGASWITVLLDCDDDVALLLTLISVALKEHDAVRGPEEEYGGPRTPARLRPATGSHGRCLRRVRPGRWRRPLITAGCTTRGRPSAGCCRTATDGSAGCVSGMP